MKLSLSFVKKTCEFLKLPLGVLALVLWGLACFYGLFHSPADYQQGDFMRIMYVHVPAAWMSLSIYSSMAVWSIIGFITRTPLWFYMARQLAPVGFGFSLITLVTGAIWGKPTWGAWWVWDARLTSMLILAFIYGAYIMWVEIDRPQTYTSGAIITIIGWVNIPIIKGSVEWWYTLHQPASIKPFSASSAIDPSMMLPLFLMFGCYITFTLFVFAIRFLRFIAFQKDYVATMRNYA